MGSHIVYNSILVLYVGKLLKSNYQEEYYTIKVQYVDAEWGMYWPFCPGNGHLNSSTLFMQNVNILRTKEGNVMKYTTFCKGINWDCLASLKKIQWNINNIDNQLDATITAY